MKRKTSAMVEAGILAAVAIVMALISVYIPVIGVFVNFLWPLPTIICISRNGLKWGIMTLVVASLVLAMVISPVHAFFLAVVFGLLGLVLGECMRRRLPPMQILFYGSIGAVVALALNFGLSLVVLGINPIEMMFSSFNESLTQLSEFYRGQGMTEEDIKKVVDGYAEMLRMMRIIMPGAFLLSAPVMAFFNYLAAKKVLKRMGEAFEDLPAFTMLQVPGWLLFPFVFSLFAVTYYYQTNQLTSWQYMLSVNIQTVCSFLFVLQGIVLMYWFVETHNKPRWWANLGTLLFFVVPFFSQVMVYVGAFDVIFDYRKIRPKRLFK